MRFCIAGLGPPALQKWFPFSFSLSLSFFFLFTIPLPSNCAMSTRDACITSFPFPVDCHTAHIIITTTIIITTIHIEGRLVFPAAGPICSLGGLQIERMIVRMWIIPVFGFFLRHIHFWKCLRCTCSCSPGPAKTLA